MKNIY